MWPIENTDPPLFLQTMRNNLKKTVAASGKRKRIEQADLPKLVQAGRELLSKGETAELVRICSDALRQLPGQPDFIHLQFRALIADKKYSEAIRFLRKWGKHPACRNANTQHAIGYGYYQIKRYKWANEHLAGVLSVKPDKHVSRLLMSRALSDAGHQEPALLALKKGPVTASMTPQDVMTYATVLHRLDQHKNAKSVLEKLLATGSRKVECVYELIRLPAETWSREVCRLVEELLQDQKLTVRQKTLLHFTAGRIADHQGRYHDAFRNFTEAKKLSTNEFDFEVFSEAAAACTSNSDVPAASLPSKRKQAGAVAPVFILGLPRSGKTTLENLLAGSAEFAACGEVSPRMFVDEDIFIGAQGQLPPDYRDRLKGMKSTQRDMYARQYIEQISEQFFLPKTTRYISSTTPHNFLNIWTISNIFPSAKFIYVQRDSRDLFTFCFMKNFKNEYNYTRDFDTFMRYCKLFRGIVSHWQNELGSSFATVSYEDMVRSPDTTVEQMYRFLDMDMSTYPASKVTTAEVGLTDRYIDHWKNYRELFPNTDGPAA